jgi:ankyrin repeat protein
MIILQLGNTEVVELLLNTPGIDINAREENGQTPLNIAAYVSYNHNKHI